MKGLSKKGLCSETSGVSQKEAEQVRRNVEGIQKGSNNTSISGALYRFFLPNTYSSPFPTQLPQNLKNRLSQSKTLENV